jgi:carbon storage regulator
MLVLSRKKGERIVIGENIVLTVAEVRGDRVKLAFQAPDEVSIHRQEVAQRIGKSVPHLYDGFVELDCNCLVASE